MTSKSVDKRDNIMNKSGRKVEWGIYVIYVIALIVISCFHEPWFDEAEAWQIARCASLSDLLFYIPHYEGHPSLWHLILAIPAKLGVPYELGLKAVSCSAALAYGWLLLFRSSFPKIVRYSLPFQYFFFYQYGVVSRQYGLMVLCLCLMAIAFHRRDEKPGRFILPMAVLCALSGYGIVLAGGLCIAWVWDICREKKWKIFTVDFWKDRRVFWLAGLLVFAVLIILQIMPREDTSAVIKTGPQAEKNAPVNSLLMRLVYTFFLMLPDSTIMTILEGDAFLHKSTIWMSYVWTGLLCDVFLMLAIIAISNKRNRHYYFIPYIVFSIFSAFVYFNAHHIGIILAFTVFWLWIALEDDKAFETWQKWKAKITLGERDQKMIRKAGNIILILFLLPALYWTAAASYLEITTPYFYGRGVAEFLKENELYKLKLMAGYDIIDPEGFSQDYDLMECVNTQRVLLPVSVLPYFDHNFCLNLNMGRDDEGYMFNRIADPEENQAVMEAWKEMGTPDVLLGKVKLQPVFGDEVKLSDYARVYEFLPAVNIWKALPSAYNTWLRGYVYLRRDLLEEYGLKEIDP